MKKSIPYIIISSLLLFASCSKEKKATNTPGSSNNTFHLSSINKKYFVSEEDARKMANYFDFFKAGKAIASRTAEERSIKEIFVLRDHNSVPAYYIINYDDNLGFLILSADYRQQAILGYNEEGNFDFNNVPIQLQDLEAEKISETEFLRLNEVDSVEYNPNGSWSFLTAPINDPPIDPETGCPIGTSYYASPNLLATTWDQFGGGTTPYNALCPMLPCGRAVTGCVATAMAQIMNYHKKPASYNWTLMSNNSSTSECARLMHDAGTSVGMNYGCASTGGSAAYSGNVAPALKAFGYASSTECYTYNYNTVVSEVVAYRPVYLDGSGSSGGHAWVCDGYSFYQDGCMGQTMLHMNWGWGGTANGFFRIDNWNPSSFTFNSDRHMVLVRK